VQSRILGNVWAVLTVMACLGLTANAQTYTAVSLKRIVELERFDKTTQLSCVWGVVIDEEGDWIVVGPTDTSRVMTCDEMLVLAKSAVNSDIPMGVRTLSDYVPGSRKTRLLYTTNTTDTVWGNHLARCISEMNTFAGDVGRMPKNFMKYPLEDHVKIQLSPETSGTSCSDTEQAFLATLEGIRISVKASSEGAQGEGPLSEWIQQVNERMPELIAYSDDLQRLYNFMQLSHLFRFANNRTPQAAWKQSLKDYQPQHVYVPEILDGDYEQSLVGSIFAQSTPLSLPCAHDARIVQFSEAVTASKRNAAKDQFQFHFQLAQFNQMRYGRLYPLVEICKQNDMTTSSYFLDFTFDPKEPKLKVFYENYYYKLPAEAAREFWALLRQTEEGPSGGLLGMWREFRETRLSPFIDHAQGKRPFLAIISNNVMPQWFHLSDVPSMVKDFDLVISRKNDRSFFDSAVDAVKQWNVLPSLSADHVAFLTSSQAGTQLKKMGELATLFPTGRFLINPTLDHFRRIMMSRDIQTVIIDLPFNRNSIRLQDGYFTIRDIMYLGRLDHIQLVMVRAFGIHSLIDSTVLEAFRSNGAGIIAVAGMGPEERSGGQTMDAVRHMLETSGLHALDSRTLVRSISGGNVVYME
jgi:hypothetical protein